MNKLTNTVNETLLFNLPHDACCRDRCTCVLIRREERVSFDDGTSGVRVVEKRVAGSFSVLPRATVEASDGWLRAPEVRSALDRGVLRLVELPATVAASPQPAAQKAPTRGRKFR